jgi:hypothetical protein
MHWLCKLIGHKHIGHQDLGTIVFFQPAFCIRCQANSLTKKGDRTLRCRVFGHHQTATIMGDACSRSWTADWCFRCHAGPITGK